MSIPPIFDDWKSILHTVFGLIAGLLYPIHSYIPVMLLVVYVTYEFSTSKNIVEAICDIVEFIVGLVLAIIVIQIIKTYYQV